MNLLKTLGQPYPSYMLDTERGNSTSLIVGLCVFSALIILQPFGLELMSWSIRFRDAIIFGCISSLFCRSKLLINGLLLKKEIIKEEDWTIGKELLFQLWFLFSLGIINWIIGHYLYGCLLEVQFFLRWKWETFSVGMVPVFTLIFIRQYNLLKKYSSLANNIEAKLSIAPMLAIHTKTKANTLITFSDDSLNDAITVNPTDISYIVAADNYIRIYYSQNNETKSQLVRGTLKNAEEKLAGYTNFYRCHRSYIVNLNCIRHISGNATGYKLHLDRLTDLIPVSRNLNNEISAKINTILVA